VLGFEMTSISEGTVEGRFAITDAMRQRFGLMHGGAYAALTEMLATKTTVAAVYPQKFAAISTSNDTSFLRGAQSESITARGRARHRERTMWVWEIDHTDDHKRLCAVSRVTIAMRAR